MFRPMAVYLGLRNVRAKTHNTFISFISLIAMLGMVLGVAVLIVVMSVMNGFETQMKIKVLGFVPHAVVISPERMPDWQTLAKHIATQDSNIQAVAPFNRSQGMVSSPQGKVMGIFLTGIVPSYERDVSVLQQQMIKGSIDTLADQHRHIIIGKNMAEMLHLGIGDALTVILPEASNNGAGIVPRYHSLTVTGIYQMTPDAEKLLAYVPMETLNTMLRQPVGAQGIRFRLNNVFLATQTANQATQAKAGLVAQNWTMTNGDMFHVIRLQKAMVSLILALIVVVAGFNLVSSLIMVVTDKTAEIAILKTLGASRRLIVQTFMVQGTAIALVGTVIGGVLGVVLALNIGRLSAWVNTTFDLDLFANYYVTQLPATPRALEIVGVMVGSASIAIMATVYPALRAANIRPIQGLNSKA